jgi:Family of unknown function (DUF6334)
MNLLARHPDKMDPMLLPPRETPYILTDVLEKRVHGCRDELILNLGGCFLRFGVDSDNDTITSQFQPSSFRGKKGYVSVQTAKPWKSYLGKECGWTWFGWDQEGYLDTVLLSFDGIVPSVLLQTIASAIEVFTISPVEKVSVSGKASGSKPKPKAKR